MAVARIEPGAGFQQHGIEAFWDASNIFLLSYSKTPRSRARPQVHPRGHHFYEFGVLYCIVLCCIVSLRAISVLNDIKCVVYNLIC